MLDRRLELREIPYAEGNLYLFSLGKKLLLRSACLLCLLLLASGCAKDGALRGMEGELNQYGYTTYVPPRANHGPGWVFRFARTFDGKTVPVSVCDRLYGAGVNPVVNSGVNFEQVQRNRTFDLSLGLALVADLLKDIQKAEASLKGKAVRNLSISWGRLQAEEIPAASRFSEDGKLLPVDARCGVALREIKERGELGSVFVVTDAVKADDLDVSFTSEGGGSIGAVVEVAKLMDFKPSVSWSETGKSSLKISEPRYLGFRAFAITDFGVTGLLGAETARIAGKPVAIGVLRDLMRD